MPQTREGRAVLAAIDRPGVWRFEPLSGTLLGLDTREAMDGLPDDLDRGLARALLLVAESEFVTAFRRRMASEKPK